jgi:two-component system chemotaxis family response regulator WspR
MGGEEFVVVLPQTTAAELEVLATRAVLAVAALNLPHIASPVADHVTISVGGATRMPEREEFPFSLVEAADKAMYEAKRAGRNRAVLTTG